MKKFTGKCLLLLVIIIFLSFTLGGCSKPKSSSTKKPDPSSKEKAEDEAVSCVGNPQKEEQRWKDARSALEIPEEEKQSSESIENPPVVVLDPGHGEPGNPGARGPSGVRERDVNLDIGKRLKILLENAGVTVIMTRSGETTTLGNPERAQIANKNEANLFFRIHCDSSSNPQDGGTRTLWYKSDSARAAEVIQRAVAKELGLQDLGIRKQVLVGFQHAQVPAVLVEVAYISNPSEEKLLADPNFRQRAAQGMHNGIIEYLREMKKID